MLTANLLSLGFKPGSEVIKLECSFKLKLKHNDWLLAETGFEMNFSSVNTYKPSAFYDT